MVQNIKKRINADDLCGCDMIRQDRVIEVVIMSTIKDFDIECNLAPEMVYVVQDGTHSPEDVIMTLEMYGGVNSNHVRASASDFMYFILPITGTISFVACGKNSEYDEFLKALNYRKVEVISSK